MEPLLKLINDQNRSDREITQPGCFDSCDLKRQNSILQNEVDYWKAQHQKAMEREQEYKKEIAQHKARTAYLEEQLYSPKTEKSSQPQKNKKSGSQDKKRKRGQQEGAPGHPRKDNSNLPSKEETREIPIDERKCPCCGLPYKEISSTDDSEILEIDVKAHKRKIKRKKYVATCQCDQDAGIKTASAAPKLIPKGIIGITIWAWVLVAKYHLCQPMNRVLKQLSFHGLNIAPGTIGDGLKKIKRLFEPIYESLEEKSREAKWWQADETRWNVFELPEGKLSYRWYLWVFISTESIVYIADPTRSAKVIEHHLGIVIGGILLVDRYSAYKSFAKRKEGIILAFCWTHMRRDFLDAGKKYPELEDWAMEWKGLIAELYQINNLRITYSIETSEFKEQDEKLKLSLTEMKEICEKELAEKKIHHEVEHVLKSLQNHWEGLTVFVDHPYIPMDNNNSERKMRIPALGRRNYYGSHSIWSAEFTAIMMSIFETAIAHGLNPHQWLLDYLTACADNQGDPPEDISTFLPWNQKKRNLPP